MLKSPDWFSSTVYAAVVYILGVSIGKALVGGPFDPLAVGFSVFILLALPIAYKLAGRKRKP